MEVYVLVPVRRGFSTVAAAVALLVGVVVSVLLSCMSPYFILLAAVFGVLWYLCTFCSYMEYEYSYFDGDIRISRVMNKSRRKELRTYRMSDVIQIAPEGDRSVYRYENDKSVAVKDYSSRQKDAKKYEMVISSAEKTTLIKFEPDDAYLDAIEQKYKQKVIRRQEQ